MNILMLIRRHHWIAMLVIVIINFLIRLLIFYKTTLFNFSDYAVYLNAVDRIAAGEKQYMQTGNLLFAISHIAAFIRDQTGSINGFFILNCIAGSLTGMVLYILCYKLTGSVKAGLIMLILSSFYTEYLVFSSVFYTPVIMIFIVSLIILTLYFYLKGENLLTAILTGSLISILFSITFFFKPELKYLPWFILVAGLWFLFKREKRPASRLIALSGLLLLSYYMVQNSSLISKPPDNIISNSFIFFGHTDYGGDGGEGTFIYPENKLRFEGEFKRYCIKNDIEKPDLSDYNNFRKNEIARYIFDHPVAWVRLQINKLFRTFGIMPESTSFKVLFTGLMRGREWLTASVIVLPVVFFLFLFIFVVPLRLRDIIPVTLIKDPFMITYMVMFIYYIIATIFYGQYQERYRMPVIVIFIIPFVGIFIANFGRALISDKRSLVVKGFIIALLISVWTGQAVRILSGIGRYKTVIELLR